jgi:hypothetical protein
MRRIRRALWCAGLLPAMLAAATAGAQSLTGFVRDSAGHPVANAEVAIEALNRRAISDTTGHFALDGVAGGMRLLSVRRVGYAPLNRMVRIADGMPPLDLRLTSLAVKLDTVRTTEQYRPTDILMMEYLDNRKMGLGHFITQADLEKMNGAPIAEAFDNVLDIVVLRGSSTHAWIANKRIRSLAQTCTSLEDRGRVETVTPKPPANPECTYCFPTVFLDFTRLSTRDEAPNINRFAATSLESVEVFPSPAQLPQRYIGSASGCGVIVFHQRRSPP